MHVEQLISYISDGPWAKTYLGASNGHQTMKELPLSSETQTGSIF